MTNNNFLYRYLKINICNTSEICRKQANEIIICNINIRTWYNTAGLWVTLFCYKIDEKKDWFAGRATVCIQFAHFPYICVGFLQVFQFPPKDEHVRWSGPSVSIRVWVHLVPEGWPVQGWFPPCTLICGETLATPNLELEQAVWKLIVPCFY